jgi:hypothetical protein
MKTDQPDWENRDKWKEKFDFGLNDFEKMISLRTQMIAKRCHL